MADFFEGLEVSAGETGDPNIPDPTIAGTFGGTIDFRNLKDAEQSADPQVTGSLEGDDFFKGLFISDPAAEGLKEFPRDQSPEEIINPLYKENIPKEEQIPGFDKGGEGQYPITANPVINLIGDNLQEGMDFSTLVEAFVEDFEGTADAIRKKFNTPEKVWNAISGIWEPWNEAAKNGQLLDAIEQNPKRAGEELAGPVIGLGAVITIGGGLAAGAGALGAGIYLGYKTLKGLKLKKKAKGNQDTNLNPGRVVEPDELDEQIIVDYDESDASEILTDTEVGNSLESAPVTDPVPEPAAAQPTPTVTPEPTAPSTPEPAAAQPIPATPASNIPPASPEAAVRQQQRQGNEVVEEPDLEEEFVGGIRKERVKRLTAEEFAENQRINEETSTGGGTGDFRTGKYIPGTNINRLRIDEPADAEAAIEAVADVMRKEGETKAFSAARQSGKTHGQMRESGDKIMGDVHGPEGIDAYNAYQRDLGIHVDKMNKVLRKSAKNGDIPGPEKLYAARNLTMKQFDDMLQKSVKAADGGEEALLAFYESYMRGVALLEAISGATARTGQALGAMRIIPPRGNARREAIEEFMKTNCN